MTLPLICCALGFLAAGLSAAVQRLFHPIDGLLHKTPWKLICCCFAAAVSLSLYGSFLYAGISEKLPGGMFRLPVITCLLLSACLLGICVLRLRYKDSLDNETCQCLVRITGYAVFSTTLLLVVFLSLVLLLCLETGQNLYDAAQILFTVILSGIAANIHQAALLLFENQDDMDEACDPYEKELLHLKKRIS